MPPETLDALLRRGHPHQTHAFHIGGIAHMWIPSTAFVMADQVQERIGDKVTGMALLTLDDWGHRFDPIRPEGMLCLDLADHALVYPEHTDALRAMVRHDRR